MRTYVKERLEQINSSLSSLHSFLQKRLDNARYWAKKDGRECTITRLDLIAQWDKQKGICVYSNQPMTFVVGKRKTNVSIDRVDNTQGYTPDNIVLCCSLINAMKTDLTQYDFQRWIITMSRADYFAANAHLIIV
jgi:hypothetical protein